MRENPMDVLIAIHPRPGSFSDRWIEYCEQQHLRYKRVNCLTSDIISELASADVLLWSWNHLLPEDHLAARHVIFSAESMGLKAFPNSITSWTFDDKLAQKYVLEAVGAPLVKTVVFYDRQSAVEWARTASYPKVFKLRRGAGSQNVKLVRGVDQACGLIDQAFGKGFKCVPTYSMDSVRKLRSKANVSMGQLIEKAKRVPTNLRAARQRNRLIGREAGYVLFQEFIPDNRFDTRITVIGDRAFGFTRNVRENDFRASGSGSIDYDLDRISPQAVQIAFDVATKLGSQSMAFDFVTTPAGEPKIVEISYGYVTRAVYACQGHWDRQMRWHEGQMWPEDAILIDLLKDLGSARGRQP